MQHGGKRRKSTRRKSRSRRRKSSRSLKTLKYSEFVKRFSQKNRGMKGPELMKAAAKSWKKYKADRGIVLKKTVSVKNGFNELKYSEFVKKYAKSHPGTSGKDLMKNAAKAWKKFKSHRKPSLRKSISPKSRRRKSRKRTKSRRRKSRRR